MSLKRLGLKRMGWMRLGLRMVAVWLALALGLGLGAAGAVGQTAAPATTVVADTIYRADGTVAGGTVLVSWPGFTTAAGASIQAGSTAAVLGAGGALTVALVPNAGSTPMGSYYTVVYHLSDGSVTREYWVIPVSVAGATVKVSAIRSTVLPASVAMQTVTKSYVDTAITAAFTGQTLATSTYVAKAGDTMTGPLVLPGDPTAPLQATDKRYVDVQISGAIAGTSQKVSTLPAGTQTVTQPVGTQLVVNNLNGTEYASQYVTGAGANGIANAAAGADCVGGCAVKAEQTYGAGGTGSTGTAAAAEVVTPTNWNNKTHLEDGRGGARYETFFNPLNPQRPGQNAGASIDVVSTQSAPDVLAATGGTEIFSTGLQISNEGLAGGSNSFPQLLQGRVPYFKTTYNALNLEGSYNTPGQHVLSAQTQNCYGVGDCLMGGMFLTASGGQRDDADEGAHPFDLQITEDARVFAGTCSLGCTTGATAVKIAATANGGTQGEGRFLIDTVASKVMTAGTLTGGTPTGMRQPMASFSGTSFPLSTFLETAATITTQANSILPGTVTVAVVTAGVPTGFQTSTAALPAASGVACVADVAVVDGRPLNFEMAPYTTIDSSHLQMTLIRAHATGATIAVGGLCGYGLEQTVDTMNGIRQLFPVIGSVSATSLLYAGGSTQVVGVSGKQSAFTNVNAVVATISRTGGVVTVTTVGGLPADVNGLTMAISGVTDTSYNGSFAVTTTGPNAMTYVEAGADSTSAGGVVSLLTGGYALYPMAEVLSVYNPATKAVDGQMTLAANTVAWAAGDTVEQPHYFQEAVGADIEFITQYVPRPSRTQAAGIWYQGNNSVGLRGWQINNTVSPNAYFGNGGTHTVPSTGMEVMGPWRHALELEAGEDAAIAVHCNLHGCDKWNSAYDLLQMDTSVGVDRMNYSPATSTLNLYLRGTGFKFNPQGMTAGTVNASTVNVTTLNAGTISGTFAGTIPAASLPVFVGSGAGHQVGAVPDAGATAGTTRFLREDGAWAVAPHVVNLPAKTSLLGMYMLTEGTGTIAHDGSGNGNDGTLGTGTAAPVWTPTGLAFVSGQTVGLPAALNAVQTIVMGVYIQPLSDGQHHPQNAGDLLVANTVNNGGINFTLYAPYPGDTGGGGFVDSAYGPNLFSAGTVTASPLTISGYHTLAATLGTCPATVDHLYVDGLEVATYGKQGCSAGRQTSGNLVLGSSPAVWGGNSGMLGQMYLAAFYSTVLSADQIGSASGLVRNEVASRGAATGPVSQPLTYGALNVAGDSITAGYPNLTPYSALLTLTNPPTTGVNNWGISGLTLSAIAGSEENRVGPLCKTATGPAVYSVFAGTNDFLNVAVATPATVFSTLTADIQKMKTAGCRVGVITMISRAGNSNGGSGAPFDTLKKSYNAMILSGARAAGADFIVDAAADTHLGADGSFANTTYFQADGTHPTQVGQQELANVYSNTYNYTFGHNKSNPNLIAAATYQMVSGDGAVSLTAAAAQAVTLPDCTGPSGAVYTINNSTAFAKTVTGGAGQAVNGLAGAVTVAANTSMTLYDVPNAETASGCHWEF